MRLAPLFIGPALALLLLPSADASRLSERYQEPTLDRVPVAELRDGQFEAAARARLRGEDWEGALAAIDRGLERNPRSAQLRFLRAVALESSGDLEAARGALTDLIGQYPEIPEPYNNLAALEMRRGSLDRAEELLRRALQLDPLFRTARLNLATLYLSRARDQLEEARRIKGDGDLNRQIDALNELLEPVAEEEKR